MQRRFTKCYTTLWRSNRYTDSLSLPSSLNAAKFTTFPELVTRSLIAHHWKPVSGSYNFFLKIHAFHHCAENYFLSPDICSPLPTPRSRSAGTAERFNGKRAAWLSPFTALPPSATQPLAQCPLVSFLTAAAYRIQTLLVSLRPNAITANLLRRLPGHPFVF